MEADLVITNDLSAANLGGNAAREQDARRDPQQGWKSEMVPVQRRLRPENERENQRAESHGDDC